MTIFWKLKVLRNLLFLRILCWWRLNMHILRRNNSMSLFIIILIKTVHKPSRILVLINSKRWWLCWNVLCWWLWWVFVLGLKLNLLLLMLIRKLCLLLLKRWLRNSICYWIWVHMRKLMGCLSTRKLLSSLL